jgi:hypothetical protein
MWKQQDQALDRHLDQVNRSGFERLQESAGESHADDVSIP